MGTPQHQLFVLILILLMVLPVEATAGNPPPENDASLRVLFVGHLNTDRHADTVLGRADAHFNYLPESIHWGIGDSLEGDAVRRDHPAPEQTTIAYPDWGNFSGSVAFQRLNRDTLTDIILYMWGSIGQGGERRDTMRGVAIFGQKKLDKVAAIDISTIGTFQEKPFVAMELRVGSELVNPESRDLSGRKSYERLPVDLDVEEADTNEHAAPLAGVSNVEVLNVGLPLAGEGVAVRVYPNPTGTAVKVEGEDFKEGIYRVEVVAMNGELYQRVEVEVDESKRLLESFDVRRLPSGHYIVRLLRDGFSLGSYPIIITR